MRADGRGNVICDAIALRACKPICEWNMNGDASLIAPSIAASGRDLMIASASQTQYTGSSGFPVSQTASIVGSGMPSSHETVGTSKEKLRY